ncbi:MAG: ThiF family adenylyltransferase [Thermoplasmata archaeon]|nr:ThiF family adenylyltransferase [Thermoplasmata archaeon]
MEEMIRPFDFDGDRFDRSRRIDWLDVNAISQTKVLMVGAGALGNEAGKNLALSGFRNITVVDMDTVAVSNLSRCLFFRESDAADERFKAELVADGINGLAGGRSARAVTAPIEEAASDLFRGSDVVLGCLDNVLARTHVNGQSYRAGKLYVDGGMEGLTGRVMVVRPPDGACLQCGMNKSHAKVASLRFSCTGVETVFHEPRLAAEITTTSVLAAIMVREIAKHTSGRDDLMLSNMLYYDGKQNRMEELEISRNPDCLVHHN